ncbi:Conserved_hypothetical protein [Hexamita inflata]|uniref:Transmembrane protein n=1 Tax=Hexamita inflata TaxID=28002 RepID=A0AA86PIM5_9EUKA|nr:Conserved hypothetical protein [Hexamita inflata]
MIIVLSQTLKIQQLQNMMKQFEADNLNIQEFNSVYDIINQANKTYYSAVVQLFPDYQDNYDAYNKRGIKPKWFVTIAVDKLQLIIDTGNQTESSWANNRLSILLSQKPNTELFFINKRQNTFKIYQKVIDQLTFMSASLTQTDNETQIRAKIGTNNTYFMVNNYSQLHNTIPFTNPTIFESTTKDIIFVFSQFSSPQILMKTLYETCSLNDRVWIYNIIDGELVNILTILFQRKFLSIISIQNNYELIIDYLLNNIEQIQQFNKLDFIQTIQKAVDEENYNLYFQIINNNVKTTSKSYFLIYLVTKNTLFLSNKKLKKQENMLLIIISEQVDQTFMFQKGQYFDLIIQFKQYQEYLEYQIQQIIQHLKNTIINDQITYGMINTTLIFLQPVYINQQYIGTIYKIMDYNDNVDWNNDVNWYDQVSRNVIMDSTGRILISRCIQPNPPHYIDQKGRHQYYPQLTLPMLNSTLFNFDQTGLIKTVHYPVYEYSFNLSDIFTKKDFVVYLTQNHYSQYRGITSISNKALSMMFRTSFKQCDQNSQEVINQKYLYYTYKSSKQFNLTQLRSYTSFSHIYNLQTNKCQYQKGTIYYNTSAVCSSSYLNIRGLIQQYSVYKTPKPECSFNLSDGFQIHFGMELLFENVLKTNMSITGNASAFIQTMKQAYQLISQGKMIEVQTLLQKYTKQKQTYGTYTTFLNSNVLKYGSNQSDINFNTNLSEKIDTELPLAIVDLMNRLDDISMFGQATQNLINLTQNKDILEVQLGHISHDSQEVILINDYVYSYNQFFEQNPEYWNDEIIISRFNMFKEAWTYYQMHYFMYTAGSHWQEMMREQLKAQPEGKKGKYRVGNIDGKLAITKALVVKNKNIDKETGVNGFLTVLLNKNFDIGIQENYTLLDENARYIHGINEQNNIKGVQSLLLQYRFLKKIRINATINDYNDIYEINMSFWDDAFNRATNQEFTVLISSDKNTINNQLNIQDYNNSEIHQRSLIFNAKSEYFFGGNIIVSQYGAIDGILVIYKNLTINGQEVLSDMIHNHSQLQIQYEHSSNIQKLEQVYQNLTARSNIVTQTLKTRQLKSQIIPKLSSFERGTIIFILIIPLLILCYFISRNIIFNQLQNTNLFYCQVDNNNYQNQYQQQNIFQQQEFGDRAQPKNYISPKYAITLKKRLFKTNLDKLLIKRNFIFENDQRVYDNQSYNNIIKNIASPLEILSYTIMHKMSHEHAYVSFYLLTSQQHYFMILNQLKSQNIKRDNNQINLPENKLIFNQTSLIFRPKVKIMNDQMNSSFCLSNSQSNSTSTFSLPKLDPNSFINNNYNTFTMESYDTNKFYNRMLENSFVKLQMNFMQDERNIDLMLNKALPHIFQLSIELD